MSNKINYIPVYKKSSDPTSVWYHFLKADTGDSAKCKTCEKVIKCAGGTTTGLRSHLRLHNISLDSERLASEVARETAGTSKRKNDNSLLESPVSAKNCRMTDYFSQSNRSLDVMVSRMTALDGMPYRAFTESEDLKHLFKKAGYKLPTSANTIKDVTIKFYDKTKKNLIKEIQELKDEGHKFSVSIDEWTSSRNRRYMNVNLHCAFFKGNHHTTRNLGLCRTYGSVTAIKCEEYLRERLHEFKLDFDTDVIAIISDGASVMTKLGGNLNCIHQLCLAHGLQLAIVDTFYVKNQENVNEAQEELAENENNLNTVCIGTEDDTETGGFQIEQAPTVTVDVETNIKFGLVVEKVRNIVGMFRKSPTKSDILQNYIKMELGKEYALILDCKTRWSTLCNMIGRFIKVKRAVLKALIDVKCDIQINEVEWSILEDIYENLDVMKVTVEAVCREDATLLSADAAMIFALKKLETRNTLLSKELHASLSKRIKQRRLPVASLMQYLHNPATYFEENEYDADVYPRLPNDCLQEMVLGLLKYDSAAQSFTCNDVNDLPTDDSQNEVGSNSSLSNKELINQQISKIIFDDTRRVGIGNLSTSKEDLLTLLKVEMQLFENGGDRGQLLSKAYRWIRSIKPTSVESERAFSAAGILCNKLRTSLSDKTINCLSFLRTYFQQKKNCK
ncbi:unnamed protein product [Parnassius apollo]|uniref:(apollo) hypothetical protein n=1 Tax=Parnassius apollo TaxID=110799 RepID=A0A8S3W9D1_PARAO|nr:unnamed protein product [Parnassius apollo]